MCVCQVKREEGGGVGLELVIRLQALIGILNCCGYATDCSVLAVGTHKH